VSCEVKFLLLLGVLGLFLIGAVYAQSNITWTFDGKGIYGIEDMSVTEKDSAWKFIGYVKNIGNNTLYVNDIVIEMFDSNDTLIEFTRLDQVTEIDSGDKLPFRIVANDINASDFDHYLVRVLHTNNSQGFAPTQSTLYYPEELYDECLRTSGESFCDFLL
jgi:hypothetical protein